MNLLESVQSTLGHAPLQKVDPNTQEIKDAREMTPGQKLAQAAIPAVLAAIIKYSDSNEGINIMTMENANWLRMIYHEKENEAVTKVAGYAGVSESEASDSMNKAADAAVKVIRENVKTADAEKLRSYMNSQRHNILNHLPAALNMGYLLNEEAFDDRTNKMEGPVSSFLHKIENII